MTVMIISSDHHINIFNLYFVFNGQDKFKLWWIDFIESHQEETILIFVFVRKDIIHLVFVIIFNFLDALDSIQLIKINLFLCLMIVKDAVILRRDQHSGLSVIHLKVLWLLVNWLVENNHVCHFFRLVIEIEYFILICKDQLIQYFSFLNMLKVKAHSWFNVLEILLNWNDLVKFVFVHDILLK